MAACQDGYERSRTYSHPNRLTDTQRYETVAFLCREKAHVHPGAWGWAWNGEVWRDDPASRSSQSGGGRRMGCRVRRGRGKPERPRLVLHVRRRARADRDRAPADIRRVAAAVQRETHRAVR